jgi:hypothetical protein
MPASAVQAASAAGGGRSRSTAPTCTTRAPCTCCSQTGRAPIAATKRRRFACTATASSPTAKPRFALA